LVLRKYKAVIFVHGCFWHRHPGCPIATDPKSNVDFWQEKFARNTARDRRNAAQLRRAGWRVFVVWECRVSSARRAKATATRVAALLRKK
jgi:DNA mismatch endonuclease (patch repair protein)